MGRQIGRGSRENQRVGLRRDGRDRPRRDFVAAEHSRLRHTIRSIRQGLRHHQQGSAALVH